jgi:hypothetical protein
MPRKRRLARIEAALNQFKDQSSLDSAVMEARLKESEVLLRKLGKRGHQAFLNVLRQIYSGFKFGKDSLEAFEKNFAGEKDLQEAFIEAFERELERISKSGQ